MKMGYGINDYLSDVVGNKNEALGIIAFLIEDHNITEKEIKKLLQGVL